MEAEGCLGDHDSLYKRACTPGLGSPIPGHYRPVLVALRDRLGSDGAMDAVTLRRCQKEFE